MEFLQGISPRKYQEEIFKTCVEKNCLVVLPTGLGKTLIALMLAIDRMKKYPYEKILFLAPTKPLAEQHLASFKKYLPELFGEMQLFTGAVKPEQRKKIWQTADIIFSTPQCVEGETMIFTKNGPIEIKEFFKKFIFEKKNYPKGIYEIAKIKEKVLGFNGREVKFLRASKALKISGGELIELKTEIGNRIVCTRDHPLMTINSEGIISWKKADELKKGGYLASVKKIEVPGKEIKITNLIKESNSLKVANKELTKELIKKLKQNGIRTSQYSRYYQNFMPFNLFLELSKKINFNLGELILTDKQGKSKPIKLPRKLDFELGYVIGAFLGDGHIGNRKGHGIEVVFSDLDRKSVNERIKKIIQKMFNINMKGSPKGLITYNSALGLFLHSLGIPKGNKSRIIQIPKYLFFAEEKAIKGFIKGIFDTDGSASKYGVSISSASKKFIQELKWLFLRIGILGNIEERKNSESIINSRRICESKIFTFRFSGRKNLKKFLEIKPDKSKCKKLTETLNSTKKPGTRSKEILPIPELMKKIRKENKNKVGYYKYLCLSTDNLRKISTNFKGGEMERVKELLEMPIRWVKIKEKKKYCGKKEVYDLTIDKHHNFIANFLINHNCIANDIKKRLYNLQNTSLLIEDEAHRCIKNYDYNYVAQEYKKQAAHPRIIGMTASPGSDSSKIKEICRNLSIEEVELRSRNSSDVRSYLQELEFEKINVDFPPEFQEMKHVLLKIFNQYIEELRLRKVLFGQHSKTKLIALQKEIMGSLARGNKNFNYMLGASACAQAIKIQHALELLETQTLESFNKYLKNLFNQAAKKQSKGVVKLVAKPEFNWTFMQSNELLAKNKEHPKIQKLYEIVEEEMQNSKQFKILIFTQFRDSASTISKKLNEIKGVNSKVFVGQAKKGDTGLSQKEQKKIIEEFSEGEINVLVATSIGEEGLDIPEVNAVIFYEPIPSAIRAIQRAGRTARLMKGKLIILITKGTRDETFYYASRAKEKKMHRVIGEVKDDLANGGFKKDEIQNKLT